MPERLRAHREGIDRLLQHVVAGVVGQGETVSLDRDELSTLLDALPVAILISTDRACTRIHGNAAARLLYQLPEGQNFSASAPGEAPFEIHAGGVPVDPDDLPLQRAARTGQPVAQSECEIRFPDGRRIFIAGHSIPIRNERGEVCGSVGAFLDLTPQRRELELLQAVSGELSHRLKNTFAIIQAIARKTLRPNLDPELYEAYENRLVSLARCQDLLHRADRPAASLTEVAALALDMVAAEAAERVSVAGPPVAVDPDTALPLSMILHELATNALKHGALGPDGGRVAIRWETQPRGAAREVCLVWEETDGPPPAPAARRSGFGTGLMTSLAKGLRGGRLDLHFAPAGLLVALTFVAEESPG
jgi:two-component sensor histidine kinase